ncbi:hypothetical protein SCB49_11522 [unidentified eubacterium SCB49]|nr:hypothetical protein SCB49_11522 [unidentified eubacterium SCB49]
MIEKTYLAAQYLAAAGIQFVEKKEDDSHTNLGFDKNSGCLITHPLSENGDELRFNYNSFSLEWKSKNETTTLALDGKSHEEVLSWLNEKAMLYLNKEFSYSFHYEGTYPITSSYVFKLSDASQLNELLLLRKLGQNTLELFVEENKLDTSIRIWPHHFDTGIYDLLPSTEVTVGLGLAIPDTLCNEFYFYASGYKNSKSINPSNFAVLKKGTWKSGGFTGAIFSAKDVDVTAATGFLKEVVTAFKNA